MHARRETAQRMLLLVGRDLHEAERVRRLLPARVGIAHAPSQAVRALHRTDVVLLEDRNWPSAEDEALSELRDLSTARRLALILSRRRGDVGDPAARSTSWCRITAGATSSTQRGQSSSSA